MINQTDSTAGPWASGPRIRPGKARTPPDSLANAGVRINQVTDGLAHTLLAIRR